MSTNSPIWYAVLFTFPQEVEEELKILIDKYNKYVTYSYYLAPHITLKYPFTVKTDFGVVEEKISTVADRTKPFLLILDGIEYWEGPNDNLAYVAIKNKRAVIDLHADIVHSLSGLVDPEYEGDMELERFRPHITIAQQIPHEVFPVVKKELSSYKVNHRAKMDSFTVYVYGEDKVWRPQTTFRFSGE